MLLKVVLLDTFGHPIHQWNIGDTSLTLTCQLLDRCVRSVSNMGAMYEIVKQRYVDHQYKFWVRPVYGKPQSAPILS